MKPDIPIGVRTIHKLHATCCPAKTVRRVVWYRTSILVLTFMSYTAYHSTRKPISVVKNVLHRNCSGVVPDGSISQSDISNNPHWCEWAPFDGDNSKALFGILDSAFLFVYAFAMFFSGFVAERVSLRYFLSLGMILTGIFCYLFGLARTLNIHYLWYFIVVQVFSGIFQSTGFPSVVTLVGRWCGKSKRGLIFGIWNSHTPIGNILGTLIAAQFIEKDWSLSFLIPGLLCALVGFIIFLYLVDDPASVGIDVDQKGLYQILDNDSHDTESSSDSDNDVVIHRYLQQINTLSRRDIQYINDIESSPMIENAPAEGGNKKAVGFFGALAIPGVIEYALCLFFSKLVSYTFLYWLPNYIQHATTMGAKKSADLSTLFDVGGIIGAILAGLVSDMSGRSALTCGVMLILAVPTMLIYERWGAINLIMNIGLLLLAGALVNGPYALITTSVSTELGSKVKGDAHALATVTAIIDGTGSLGAAVGPLLAGLVSQGGWVRVFYMLMVADVLALIMLSRLIFGDCKKKPSANERTD